MKQLKYILIISIITLNIININTIFANNQNEHLNKRHKEAKKELKLLRKQWVKDMHRCSEDINYKIIDLELREFNYKNNLSKINDVIKNNKPFSKDNYYASGLIKAQWIERGSNNQAGRIHTTDFDEDDNVIYAASAGGNIWKANIDGSNWTCLNNNIQFDNIRMVKVFNFNDKKRIVVLANKELYYSDNDGLTWNTALGLDLVKKWGGFKRGITVKNSDNSIYLLASEWDWTNWNQIISIYVSNDFGSSFSQVLNSMDNTGITDIWTPFANDSTVYYLNKNNIFSINKNNELTKIGSIDTDIDFSNVSTTILTGSSINNKTYLYALIKDNDNNIYASQDSGKTWEFRSIAPTDLFEYNSMNVSINNPKNIFIGGVDLYRSYDAGATWQMVNSWGEYYSDIENKLHADIPGILSFIDSDNKEFQLIGSDGGLYISRDSISTVKNISLFGLNVSQYYSTYTNRSNLKEIYAGSQDQGFQVCYTDSTGTLGFKQEISGDYGQLSSSDSGKTVWCVYPGFLMLNTYFEDANRLFFWEFSEFTNNWMWMPNTCANPLKPNRCYIAAGSNNENILSALWAVDFNREESSFSASTYNFDFSQGEKSQQIAAIAVSNLDTNNISILTNNGKFFYTKDGAKTWNKNEELSGPEAHYFYGSTIIPSSKKAGRLFIAGSGYSNPGFCISDDFGESFYPQVNGLPNTLIYKIAISQDENFIFAATEIGPYVYVVKDSAWFSIADINSPDQVFWSVEYIPETKTARFSTYGRGIWDFKITEFINTTNIKTDTFTNKNIELKAYPNPITSATKISFNIPVRAEATIRIYDLEGRIVNQLYSGVINSGYNEFLWSGKTEKGNNLPNGNYFCTITYSGYVYYTKLIIKN